MRPPLPNLALSRRWKIVLAVVAVIIVLLVIASALTNVYVNWLWYGEVGFRRVYRTILWTRIILFVIFGALMALIIGGNLAIAYLLRPPFRPMSAEQQNLERYRVMIEPRKVWILVGASALAFLTAGLSAQNNWQTWLLWLEGGSFGQQDPQFHRDISFFAWDYPAYRAMLGFGFTAVLFALILSIVVHYLSGAIRLQTPGPKVTPAARRHLTILVFVFVAMKAVAYWLDRYGLVFSNRSSFTGASYTDVHASLQAKTILFWLALIIAAGVLASMWLKSTVLPAIGFVVLLVLSILISGIYPAILQQVSVKPNASTKEAPYILRNIDATRQAYGITTATEQTGSGQTQTLDPNGAVSYVNYAATANPAPSAVTTPSTTVNNVRVLDPNVISPTVANAQRVKNPYGFAPGLDMDRYTINGVEHDYVVGVRELVPQNLQGSQGNWINLHTFYTHGYGFVAAEADQDVTNGQSSDYTEGDIPPTGKLDLSVPQAYFGELMTNYSIVGAHNGTQREYDGSDGLTTYSGKGGVSLSNFFTRLAFAVHFKQTNFLLNSTASASGARVIFNRDPRARVEKVAPFLTVDSDPYPAVVNGRIVWIVDAYTTMSNFPYSQQKNLSDLTHTSLTNAQSNQKINYIRNSVKATVDAYDGTVSLYDWDPTDPVLKAWMKIFPGTIKPQSAMPAEVLAHVRYPQDLFDVQRGLLEQYHVDNPVTFYNVAEKWTVPTDPFNGGGQQPPYYVLASPPAGSSTAPEFQLTSPMLVNNSQNLAAYVSVNSDCNPTPQGACGPDYGKITVLKVPTNSGIQGPTLVANVFKTKAQISKDISLLDTGQSRVIHGNLLTLPIGNSFLYVEPLYVQSTYPTLQRVLVTYGQNIGYGATLADALSDLQPGHVTGETLSELGTTTTTSPPATPTPPATGSASTTPPTTAPTGSSTTTPSNTSTTVPSGQAALLNKISSDLDALQSAYKSGNLADIGKLEQTLNDDLTAYKAKYGSGAH